MPRRPGRRVGAEVTVYESHTDPAGPVGSFISVAVNGLRALDALGCLDRVRDAGFPVARQRLWSGSGKLLGDVPRGRLSDDPLYSVTLWRGRLVEAAAANREAKTAGPVRRRVQNVLFPLVLRFVYEHANAWLYAYRLEEPPRRARPGQCGLRVRPRFWNCSTGRW